jgi:glycosyltransferase involved in cell wall biosynthesis
MKIALDISPLASGNFLQHRVRGAGVYVEKLMESLERFHPENQYYYFQRGEDIPNNVDLVHYPYFEPFFLTLPFLKKAKTVVTVHDLIPFVYPDKFPAGLKGNLKWYIQKRSLQRCDHIVTDSIASKKDIVKFASVDESKVSHVYIAAGEDFKPTKDEKKLIEVRKKYHLPDKFLLYVGDVTWNKNLVNLVESIKGSDYKLVMVGKALVQKDFDTTNPWNQDLFKVQGLVEGDDSFIRPGFIPNEELACLYHLATLSIMPSFYEGFGLPVLEAMQSGCPVITTDRGSLKEIGGDAVYYVDPESKESIIRGIKSVFDDSDLKKKMISKGLKQAEKFSWGKTASDMIDVYKKVVA